MRVKISVKNLLEAFAIADSGAKAVVRKVSRTKTECTPAMLTFEARCAGGGALKIRTLGEFPAAVVTTSAVVEAIVEEEGVHSCDLEDARAAFAKLKKTAKRGTWVDLSSDDFSDSVLTRTGNTALPIPKDRDTRVDDFADVPAVAVIPSCGIRAALDMSKGMVLGVDGELFGHVVSFGHGIAAASDNRNAEFLAMPTVPDDASPIHVPRQVLTVLARSPESAAHIADGYASSGAVRVTWRLIGNRTHADFLFGRIRGLADGKAAAATTIDGGELRQALASLSAFLAKGDAIRLIPDECGVRILRYDVRDDAHDLYVTRKVCEAPTVSRDHDVVVGERQTLADRAEVLVGALWPLPRAVTLPASRLKRILGNADGLDLCLDRDPCGPVAAHVHGDPVVHLMCQCPCPFNDADTI